MYESYWELSEPPFDNSPNPKFFYLSPEHEEALVRLVYTVRHRKGCGMLTGEYGCGKTTLSRALIQRLEAERYEIGLYTHPSNYIGHRLRMAGQPNPLFTEEAIKLIFDFTRGTPREINNLCDVALLVGYSKRVKEIGEKIIAEVIKDMVGVS